MSVSYTINGINFTDAEGVPYVSRYAIEQTTYFVHVTVHNQTDNVTVRADILDNAGTLVQTDTDIIGTGPGLPYNTNGSVPITTVGLSEGRYLIRVYTDGDIPGPSETPPAHIWVILIAPYIEILGITPLGPYSGTEILSLSLEGAGVSGIPAVSLAPEGGGPDIYSGGGTTIPLTGTGITTGTYIATFNATEDSDTWPVINSSTPTIRIIRYSEVNYGTLRPGTTIRVYWTASAVGALTTSLSLIDASANVVGLQTGLDPVDQIGFVVVDPDYIGGSTTLRVVLTNGITDIAFAEDTIFIEAPGIFISDVVPNIDHLVHDISAGYIDIIPSFGGTNATSLYGRLIAANGSTWPNVSSYSTAINAYVEYHPIRQVPTGTYYAYIESGQYWNKTFVSFVNARVLSVLKNAAPTDPIVAGDDILADWEGLTTDVTVRLYNPDFTVAIEVTAVNGTQQGFSIPLTYTAGAPLSNGLLMYVAIINATNTYGSELYAFTLGAAIDNVQGLPGIYSNNRFSEAVFKPGDRINLTWSARGTTATMNAQFFESDHTTPAGSPITGLDSYSGSASIQIPTGLASGLYYVHLYDDGGSPIEQETSSDLSLNITTPGSPYAYDVSLNTIIAVPGDTIHVTWDTSDTGTTAINLLSMTGVLIATQSANAEDLSGDIVVPSNGTGLMRVEVFNSSPQSLWIGSNIFAITSITVNGQTVVTYYPGDPLLLNLNTSGLTDVITFTLYDLNDASVGSVTGIAADATEANFKIPMWIANGTYSLVGSTAGMDSISTALTVASFVPRTRTTTTDFQAVGFGNINAIGPRITLQASIDRIGLTTSSGTQGFVFDVSNNEMAYISAGVSTSFINLSSGVFTVRAQEFITTSDESVKRDIVPFDGGMNIVSELQPVMYRYRSAPEGPLQVGLIAQHVEHVLPNVVSLVDGIRGVAYDRLVTVLVNALKEQSAQISTMRSDISELRNDITSLMHNNNT